MLTTIVLRWSRYCVEGPTSPPKPNLLLPSVAGSQAPFEVEGPGGMGAAPPISIGGAEAAAHPLSSGGDGAADRGQSSPTAAMSSPMRGARGAGPSGGGGGGGGLLGGESPEAAAAEDGEQAVPNPAHDPAHSRGGGGGGGGGGALGGGGSGWLAAGGYELGEYRVLKTSESRSAAAAAGGRAGHRMC
jgi:hypothetical protein